jgi:ribosomal protein S18 acetylase RimI-like enzyme
LSDIQINIATSKIELENVHDLFLQYARLRNHDAALGNFTEELTNMPGKYASPKGTLLIAYFKNQPAGVVAFQPFAEGICEMKRMFVSPTFQGQYIGHSLLNELLSQARKSGYQKMYLDTHPWMKSAQHLYQKFGFHEIERYNDNPTPGIRFFALEL